MLSQSAKTALAICIYALISHAFGDSDIKAINNPIDEDLNDLDDGNNKLKTKSDDMPASIVLLLLCIFVSLGLVCIRHIKREWTQQQQYLLAKQAGAILGGGSSIAAKSYGSTSSPRLNADTIDEYIEDSLYGNNPLMDRLNQYRNAIQQRFVEYMERTPEPVLFEANPDKSIEAYNKNPEIPDNPNYEPKPFKHSENYKSTPPPALQRLFQRNYDKNQKRRGLSAEPPLKSPSSKSNTNKNKYDNSDSDGGYDEIKEDVQETINELTKKRRKIGGFPIKSRIEITPPPQHLDNMNRSRISLSNQINNDDFDDDYNNNYYGIRGGGDYNTIPDNNYAYSDSDKNLSDGDNGAYQNIDDNKTETTMVVKVLDLD